MPAVHPWIPVAPSANPAAILGSLPFARGSVSYTIPESVVPPDAEGILVFAWAILRGVNPDAAYWHVASTTRQGPTDWFSLLIGGDPNGASVTCNSQAFWLPMPANGTLVVTLAANDLPSSSNTGKVEIHGYYPAGSS